MTFWETTLKISNRFTKELHFKRFCYFSCRWFGIYKHIITRADEDKHDHDHPWDFLSIVLEGWYYDDVDGIVQKIRGLLSFKFIKAEYHHKISAVGGKKNRCVTLIVTGPRRREWGYTTEKGWIDNKMYRSLKKFKKL